MASHEETIEIFGRPEEIFDLVHDCSRRLADLKRFVETSPADPRRRPELQLSR